MKKNYNYFGKKQEVAIKDYLLNENLTKKEKNELYKNIIYPAFYKLTENILAVYGLKYGFFQLPETSNELILEGISYMHNKLCKFDPTRISKLGETVKAFSFFGTILKRYFIKKCIDDEKFARCEYKLDDGDIHLNCNDIEELHYTDKLYGDNWEKVFVDKLIVWYTKNLNQLFTKEEVKQIVKAILEIFKRRDSIESFNKKQLYIYIREITGQETKRITPIINKMKVSYVHLRHNYINHDKLISGSISI